MADHGDVAGHFSQFARITRRESPLYSALSAAIAADPELVALAAEAFDRQPPANVLFAAVHFLLLRGADHPLADYYHSAGGTRAVDGGEFSAFASFCSERRTELLALIRTGRVQTNEPRRATFLVPGFAWVASRTDRPLATLEVGTAAGLLTLWDRYAYDYGDDGHFGESSLTLSCQLRGGVPELGLPQRAWSAGIDLEPVDVDDVDAADWLRALVWPDQEERLRRLEAAIAIARAHPPRLIAGNGIDLVGEVGRSAPADAVLVVHHSFAFNQVTAADRFRFEQQLMELSTERDVYLVAVEWAGHDDPPELRAGKALPTEVPRKTLARVHHHGAWLDWVA